GDLDLLVARFAASPEQALARLANGKADEASGGGVAVFLNVGEALPAPVGAASPGLTVKFQRHPETEKLLGSAAPVVGVAVTDADADHDLDLILLEERAVPAVVLNDRLLRFRRAALPVADARAWTGALVLDVDHSERSDLLLIAAGQVPLLLTNWAAPGQEVARPYEKGALKYPPP